MAKVLLVEDDNNLREIYEARLTAEGYEIFTAQNGEEALSVAKQSRPDLIISDVMMPRISGFEMLDIMRNTDELKNTKIIMLTALGQAEDRGRADNLGADKYLVKSQVTLEDIVRSAEELLSDGPVTTPSGMQAPVPEEPTAQAATETTAVAAEPTTTEPEPAPAVEAAAPTDAAPAVAAPVAQVVVTDPDPIAPPAPVAQDEPALVLSSDASQVADDQTQAIVEPPTPDVSPVVEPEPEVATPATEPEVPESAGPSPTAEVPLAEPPAEQDSDVPPLPSAPPEPTVIDPAGITEVSSPEATESLAVEAPSQEEAPSVAPEMSSLEADEALLASHMGGPITDQSTTTQTIVEATPSPAPAPAPAPDFKPEDALPTEPSPEPLAPAEAPEATPATSAANDALLNNAVDQLTTEPDVAPTPVETTAVQPEPTTAPSEEEVAAPDEPVTESSDSSAGIRGHKTIEPIAELDESKPDLAALLAAEEAKEQAGPAPVPGLDGHQPAEQASEALPPAAAEPTPQPNGGVDPNKIAL